MLWIGSKTYMHQRHAPQDNKILPTEVANLLTESGSGDVALPTHLISAGTGCNKDRQSHTFDSKINQSESLFKNTRSELETN